MINDPLDVRDATRKKMLDRFRNWILVRCSDGARRACLLDVGSSSGKFLWQNSLLFDRVVGIEITPAAVEFSRHVLGLDVREKMEEIHEEISVATFWHSLEHIATPVLCDLLERLARQMGRDGRIVISVPNNRSFQYRLFRRAYAFFDVPNHEHQFSPKSLRMLLRRYGFVENVSVFSWPYNVFGHVQSLLNIVTGSYNYLYYRLKRNSVVPTMWRDAVNMVLLPVVVPLGLALTMLDLAFPERQGVLTVCFKKA